MTKAEAQNAIYAWGALLFMGVMALIVWAATPSKPLPPINPICTIKGVQHEGRECRKLAEAQAELADALKGTEAETNALLYEIHKHNKAANDAVRADKARAYINEH